MRAPRLRTAAVLLAASVSLGGCATYGQMGGVGVSVGYGNPYHGSRYGYSPYGYSPYGYSPYGYSRYGYSPYGYSPYGYSRYGYSPYWGWNDGFYYPGTGFYVYDRYRRPYRMTDRQRRYWSDRQRTVRSGGGNKIDLVQNWDDFRGVRRTDESRVIRRERSDDRPTVSSRVTTRAAVRAETRQERRTARQQARPERRKVVEVKREEKRDD